MKPIHPLLAAATLRLLLLAASPNRALSTEPDTDEYTSKIKPILAAKCFDCHARKKTKAGLDLARFDEPGKMREAFRVWEKVNARVAAGEMPPEGEPMLSESETKTLQDWHRRAFVELAPRPSPGVPRRLTRTEYRNTLEDLLGLPLHEGDHGRFYHAEADSVVEKLLPIDPPGPSGFDNDAAVLSRGAAGFAKYLQIAEHLVNLLDSAKEAREAIYAVKPAKNDPTTREKAQAILERFAFRAFRRPVAETELVPLLGVFDKAILARDDKAARGPDELFHAAIKEALTAILVSPKFLFRFEKNRDSREPYRIDDFELASRLSYFLWSTMPDEELFRLAAERKLSQPAILERQVARLLAHPRSIALAQNFAGQWLGFAALEKVDHFQVQRPDAFIRLQRSMYREPLLFFDDLARSDRSLLELIDSKYSFINQTLGTHYALAGYKKQKRLEGQRGSEDVADPLVRISLHDPNRGGVLTMASTMTMTSAPERTSPIRRGVWILDAILGERPADPPPNTPPLEEASKNQVKLTMREQMKLHRAASSCAQCHNSIDPLGLALENYGPLGIWRVRDGEGKIDASTVLPTGEKVSGPVELKALLLAKYKDKFARNAAEKMLAYALGRPIRYTDRPSLDQLAATLKANDYRLSVLVKGIVASVPFQYRVD